MTGVTSLSGVSAPRGCDNRESPSLGQVCPVSLQAAEIQAAPGMQGHLDAMHQQPSAGGQEGCLVRVAPRHRAPKTACKACCLEVPGG